MRFAREPLIACTRAKFPALRDRLLSNRERLIALDHARSPAGAFDRGKARALATFLEVEQLQLKMNLRAFRAFLLPGLRSFGAKRRPSKFLPSRVTGVRLRAPHAN
jgi:hypothetical protein